MVRCKSCDTDTSSFVSKFYGAFNSIMHVLGYKRNEMVAVQLVGSYCLPSLLYGCEVWQTRADDVRSASVAWNNCFRKIFNACWRESVKPLLIFCSWLISFISWRMLYWTDVYYLTMCYYRPWPDVMITLVLYVTFTSFTIKNLVDLPTHLVKELFWERTWVWAFTYLVTV